MKINGIKIEDGYLLVVKTGESTHNMTVVSSRNSDGEEGLACATPGEHWWPLKSFNSDGNFFDSDVVAIYGRTSPRLLLDNKVEGRKLLWPEEELIDMTLDEIQKKLGQKIRIVEKKAPKN